MTNIVWYLVRSTGIVAYLLLYLSVMVGLFSQVQKKRKKKINNIFPFHESLANWSFIMVIIHITSLLFDTFVSFKWYELVIPFATDYKKIPIAIGIIAFYGFIVTFVTTKWRKQIGIKTWRKLHILTPILYVLVTIHGFTIGTDLQSLFLFFLNIVPLSVFLVLLFSRHLISKPS